MSAVARYAVIGAGGFGREVMPLLRSQLARELADGSAKVCFVVEEQATAGAGLLNGLDLLSLETFLSEPGPKFFNVAIADSLQRMRIAQRCLETGARPVSIMASNAICLDENVLGEGLVACPFTMITSNATIGRFVHLNIYSYVAHDCVLGDFVTFAPGVQCNGNVVVEDHAYVGTGAVIRPGRSGQPLVIGQGAVVGMGAVVTKDVESGSVVVGNPARAKT